MADGLREYFGTLAHVLPTLPNDALLRSFGARRGLRPKVHFLRRKRCCSAPKGSVLRRKAPFGGGSSGRLVAKTKPFGCRARASVQKQP
eukprot:4366295-Alexandrium_andersonii.AAC.1